MLEVILDQPPPPPPPNVPELAETAQASPDATLRQQMEIHRANPVCASCHQTMDALGFGMENFDAIGRWRETDGDKPLDTTGTLPGGKSFHGPKELIAVLKQRDCDFAKALSGKMLTYALGRGRNSETYTSHGDVFSIWGAKMKPDRPHPKGGERCLPSERRAKPSPEWNHYRVTCKDGVLKLAVNGKEVSGGSECKPRKGYICLESEGSECHFRNLKICELPSTNPKPEEVAAEYQGFKTMYSGLDLAGWKTDPANKDHWQAKDWVLFHDGQGEAKDKKYNHLWTEKNYRNFEMVVDWRLDPKRITRKKWPIVLPSGDDAVDDNGKVKELEVDDAGNSGILLRGNEDAQINICCRPVGSGEITAFRVNKELPAEIRAGCTPKKRVDAKIGTWNRFIITVNGEQVSVILNGEKIIDSVRLPGMPESGPIGLQQHGEPLEFANLFIRELP